MYTVENKNNFSFKNVALQFLFVALFIFIMIWLFPLKSDLKRVESKIDNLDNSYEVLYDRIFNENVIAMKDGAKSYFTTSRLPKNVNDTVKMTLKEMLDAKIVLPFTDKNGKKCDETASYIEIVKHDDEYVMKVNLKCGKQENYLLVYMGCYDYCSTTICEKNKSDVKQPVIYTPAPAPSIEQPVVNNTTIINNNTTITNTTIINNIINNIVINNPEKPEEPEQPDEPTPSYETLYEYKKVEVIKNYTDWSSWSTIKPASKSNREIEKKTINIKKLVGFNKVTKDDYDKPIFSTVDAVIGQLVKQECTNYDYVKTGEVKYSDWQYQYTASFKTAPVSTSYIKYESVGNYNWYCDENCTSGTVFLYKVYTRKPIDVVKYTCTHYEPVPKSIVAKRTVLTGYEKKTEMQEVYEESKKYEYRYREYSENEFSKYEWSNSNNDSVLIAQGYKLTGKTKTVLKNN